MERPIPAGILVRVKLALQRDDDGNEMNKIRRFECAGVEPPDAFAPADVAGPSVPSPSSPAPEGGAAQ
jgi:hypothetical protein